MKYLPRTRYDLVKYRGLNLKTALKILRENYKVKTFVIADNDEEGQRAIKDAEDVGLQKNTDLFQLSKKDVLSYIPPKILYNALMDIIGNVLKIDMDRLKHIKIQVKKKENEHEKVIEIGALNILKEIERYGIIKKKTDLLRLLINRGLSKEVSDEVLNTRGWKRRKLYHTLKPIMAEKAMKEMKEVPDEIERVLDIIDNNVREVVQI